MYLKVEHRPLLCLALDFDLTIMLLIYTFILWLIKSWEIKSMAPLYLSLAFMYSHTFLMSNYI
jgi:hypothetical protein